MATLTENIGEKLRRNTRYKIRAYISIAGKDYKTNDWSFGGFAINIKNSDMVPPNTRTVTMLFNIDNYNLSFEANVIERYRLPTQNEQTRIGFEFDSLESDKLALLHHIAEAYLNGRIINAREMISTLQNARELDAASKPPKAEELPKSQRLKIWKGRLISWLITLTIFLVALGVIANAAFSKLFLYPISEAWVSAETVPVAIPMGGTVLSVSTKKSENVAKDTALAEIQGIFGHPYEVYSPCECSVLTFNLSPGDQVETGKADIALLPIGASLEISGRIPIQDAYKANRFEFAKIDMRGLDQPITGKVIDFFTYPEDGYVRIKIIPDKAIDLSRFNEPVSLTLTKVRNLKDIFKWSK